jgi:hypothetical protein
MVLYSDGVAAIRSPKGHGLTPEELAHRRSVGGSPQADVAAVISELARLAGGALASDDASIRACEPAVGR